MASTAEKNKMTQPKKDPTPPLLGPSAEDETNTISQSMSLTTNNRSVISRRSIIVVPPEKPLPFKNDNEATSALSFCSPRKWTMLGVILVVIACIIVVVLVNAEDEDDDEGTPPTASPSLRGER